jgi:HEAT repeat protein
MKLRSIETTPNPNCMMLKVDENFGDRSVTIEASDPNLDRAPQVARDLLALSGVRSVFLSRDFITLTRSGGADWKPILEGAGRLLGEGEGTSAPDGASVELDRVEIAVLEFRGLPSQVRVSSATEQARVALPDRFGKALERVLDTVEANYLRERSWRAQEPRLGDPAEVAQMVAEELDSRISDPLLTRLEDAARAGPSQQAVVPEQRSPQELLADLSSPDGRLRLSAIQVIKVDDTSFPMIAGAMSDDKPAVRRWAAAVLGSSRRSDAVEPLCAAVVSDPSVIVRRAAGDSLSDLGYPEAIPAMCQALSDTSHLVRWRAARYLNETGDESALEALVAAIATESDFGIRLEMNTAKERIQSGGESQMPMWLRLARGVKQEEP